MTASIELIRRYYDGCSTGNVDAMLATLHDEVVHYFLVGNPGSAPVRGGEHLARYWRKVTGMIDATWVVDHAVVDGNEAVIEWTMLWYPAPNAARVATRGAEWFVFRDNRIAEIRSYYRQRDESTGLDGFDYLGRGYSAPGAEQSPIHSPAIGEPRRRSLDT